MGSDKRLIKAAFVVVALALGACGTKEAGSDDLARVTFDLTGAPLDARCMVITVTPQTGTPVVQQFSLVPNDTAVFDLSNLPLGMVVFTEQAFTVACPVSPTQAPTWVSDPVPATLTAGNPVVITFNLVRVDAGGQATARSNFPGAANAITQFSTPGTAPFSIVTGPDDNLWFADEDGQVGRMTTAGSLTLFPLSGSSPAGITSGPDGNLWVTEFGGNRIARVTVAGASTEFTLPTPGSNPLGIVTGRDGMLYFTESGTSRIGRMTSSGALTEFTIPTASSTPRFITVGPDNNIWFTEGAGNKIGRLTAAGAITEFTVPTTSSFPEGIVTGPDGNLWFTENEGNRVGRITPGGSIIEFSIPTALSGPRQIASGPDGNLWFAQDIGAIARITTVGVLTEFFPPIAGETEGVTRGPDGKVWFTSESGNGHGVGNIQP
jgi:streptogramin lyase